MTLHEPRSEPPEFSGAAIRALAEQGYEQTTAGQLADALGMSRSTFFRRFGSKDDVVFADHELALSRLSEALADSGLSVEETVVRGSTDVLELLTRDPEAARLRFELLRSTPALRDRELIITHRYERTFTAYLQAELPEGAPEWVPSAIAAGIVSVHNSTMRRWLRGADTRRTPALGSDLREYVALFRPWLGERERTERTVVVAVYDTDVSPDRVLDSVAESLRTARPAPGPVREGIRP